MSNIDFKGDLAEVSLVGNDGHYDVELAVDKHAGKYRVLLGGGFMYTSKEDLETFLHMVKKLINQ